MYELTVPNGYEKQMEEFLSKSSTPVTDDTLGSVLQDLLASAQKGAGGNLQVESFDVTNDAYMPKTFQGEKSDWQAADILKKDNTALLLSTKEGAVFCVTYIKAGDKGYLHFLSPEDAVALRNEQRNMIKENNWERPKDGLTIFERICNFFSQLFLNRPAEAVTRKEAYRTFYFNLHKAINVEGTLTTDSTVTEYNGRKEEALQQQQQQITEEIAPPKLQEPINPLEHIEEKFDDLNLTVIDADTTDIQDELIKEEKKEEFKEEKQPEQEKEKKKSKKEDHSQEIAQLEVEISAAQTQIETLESKIKEETTEHFRAQDNIDTLEMSNNQMTQSLPVLRRNAEDLTKKVKELETQIEECQKKLDEFDRQKQEEQKALDDAKAELEKRRMMKKAVENNLSSADAQLQEQQAKVHLYKMDPKDYLKHRYEIERDSRQEAFQKEQTVRATAIQEQSLQIEGFTKQLNAVKSQHGFLSRTAEEKEMIADLEKRIKEAEQKKKALEKEDKEAKKAFDAAEEEKRREKLEPSDVLLNETKQWQKNGLKYYNDRVSDYEHIHLNDMEVDNAISVQNGIVNQLVGEFNNKWAYSGIGDAEREQMEKLQKDKAAQKSQLEGQTDHIATTEKAINENKEIIEKAKPQVEQMKNKLETDQKTLAQYKNTLAEKQKRLEELKPSAKEKGGFFK